MLLASTHTVVWYTHHTVLGCPHHTTVGCLYHTMVGRVDAEQYKEGLPFRIDGKPRIV